MENTNKILVALAGNPNAGKSTIFNNLTGSNQHIANYPGVTVEKKEGLVKYKSYEITIVDLPGTYSLSANSEDEIVARDFILNDKPDIIINIVDASNLERNLYLYTQLAELGTKIIIALNMVDMLEAKGGIIDYDKLSKTLNVPVIPTIGNKKQGMEDLFETIIKTFENKVLNNPLKVDFSNQNIAPNEDIDVVNACKRYDFVGQICSTAIKTHVKETADVSDKIDKIILNRFLGLPIFAFVMYAIFKFTFTFSEPVVNYFESGFEWLGTYAASIIPDGLLQSLVVDGIIGGIGGVLGFFPLILFMFFAIAFFEDSGYMARAAFVMDRIMHKFGLHGKSFLPLMISTNGCAVPGILASRTLESKKDRLITMMVTPFMICGAKLPIFALFIGAFFPEKMGANIMFLMYILSIIIAFLSAFILKSLVFKGAPSNFVMELPPYRLPTITGLLLKMWQRGWMYVKKAGTTILVISILIWAGFTFPQNAAVEDNHSENAAAAQMEQSYAGRIGKFIEPVISPLGMGWREGVALLAGFAAKEVVVSTFGTIYSLGEVDPENPEPLKVSLQNDKNWNPLKAFTFLIFSLIYLPCFVTIVVFFKESGNSVKWTSFLIIGTTLMAWLASFSVYQIGLIFRLGV